MVRLFVGSFLKEDEAARIDQFCTANQESLGALTTSSLRFVRPANFHITWVFLGEVAEEKVEAAQAQLRREVECLKYGLGIEIETPAKERKGRKVAADGLGKKISINVQYDYLEAWPTIHEGRVLVATPTTVPEPVLRIGMALRAAMAHLSKVDLEEARNALFRPHITIARLNPPANFGDGKLLGALSQVLPISQHIDSLHLIKSHHGQGSGDYEIIDSAW
jgi:2'-5' RNA ligase